MPGTKPTKRRLLKRIHVNQHNLRANAQDNGTRPCFTVKTSKRNHTATEVHIKGTARLVSPGCKLACGARAWIETRGEVLCDGVDIDLTQEA